MAAQRREPTADQEPVEGVPDWLFPNVWGWIFAVLAVHDVAIDHWEITEEALAWVRSRLRFKIVSESGLKSFLEDNAEAGGEKVLDLVQHILTERVPKWDPGWAAGACAHLETMLSEAHSVWRVGTDDATVRGGSVTAWLERRETAGMRELVEEAIAVGNGDAAAHHLEEACRAILGRDPKPDRAWDQAIKAVEAAARPVLAPNDDELTLGRICGVLKDERDLWSVRPDPGGPEPRKPDSGGAQAIELLGRLIWHNHPRHANQGAAVIPNPEDAQIAVHSAALLVYLFRSGAVRKRSQS